MVTTVTGPSCSMRTASSFMRFGPPGLRISAGLRQPARSTCSTAWVRTLLIVVLAIVAAWIAFVAFVALAKPDDTTLRDALRLLPDIARLVRRLVADPAIPRRTRWLVWFLLGYLVLPIDIVPD